MRYGHASDRLSRIADGETVKVTSRRGEITARARVGRFFYTGSISANLVMMGTNHISADGSELEWDDFYFTDEKENGQLGVFYNKSGMVDIDESEEMKISDDDIHLIADEWSDRCVELNWTPVREYTAKAGSGDKTGKAGSREEYEEPEQYGEVLNWYKEIQDSGKSWEEMEEYESQTGLVQYGWPYSTDNNEIRYVYADLTGDGYDELIITYYNDPVDIYTNGGDAVYAYSVPYRAIAEIYPDGWIMQGIMMGKKGWNQTWYRYDDKTHKYVPVKEDHNPETSSVILHEGRKIADVEPKR